MSVEVMAAVLHHSKAKGTDKLVLIGIANHSSDGGAWPSIATLAKYANVSERSVQRSLDQLVSAGELIVHRQQGGTLMTRAWNRTNRYDVTVACPAGCDRTPQHRVKPLPSAPADLWITGVTPTSPGDAHVTGGVTPTSPGGVTPTSPEPSIEPSLNDEAPASTTGQAPDTAGICQICSKRADECRRAAATNGHSFTPRSQSRASPTRRTPTDRKPRRRRSR